LGIDAAAVGNLDMTHNSNLHAHVDIFAQFFSAPNAPSANNNRSQPDFHNMRDLDQVIEFGTGSDQG
jgi:hypothetical protein